MRVLIKQFTWFWINVDGVYNEKEDQVIEQELTELAEEVETIAGYPVQHSKTRVVVNE